MIKFITILNAWGAIKNMTKKEKNSLSFEDKVREKMNDWQTKLFLHSWMFTVKFPCEEHENPEVAASTSANPEYHQATITFYPSARKHEDDLEEFVAHEMMHCVLAQYQHLATARFTSKAEIADSLESTTTILTRIVLCLDKKY
jgi:hypothetical protein